MKKYPKIVQIDARGQIVIPKDIRNELKAFEGTGFFVYSIDNEGILLKKIPAAGLGENKKIINEIIKKSDRIKISKSNLRKAIKKYKKSKEGNLEIV